MILTLALHAEDQARFERLRVLHFPPRSNLIPAHLTLFHHLPGTAMDIVRATVAAAAAAVPPFPVEASGLRFLGRGSAYMLEVKPLLTLRAGLARTWHEWLTLQDRQGWRPHVTIQNKAAPAAARTLFDALQAGFTPFTVRAEGLLLWRYLGGPWEPLGHHPFGG